MSLKLQKPLIYVTRDIERALGMKPEGLYFIISNDTAYGREVQRQNPEHVFLIADPRGQLDTFDLLTLPEVAHHINSRDADIVVFQNTSRIERLARENKWNLINPPASLAQTVEEKISQITWLTEDTNLLPPHSVVTVKDVRFTGQKIVLQFNHSHTGQGTYIITSQSEIDVLAQKFPHRECRIVDFIEGPVFTVNVVVGSFGIIVGNPSYQITGMQPFTDLPFSTIGNDWTLPQTQKFRGVSKDTTCIARTIGKRMQCAGWRGMFGIDVIYDTVQKKTHLLEINARQPASAVYESILQKKYSKRNVLTLFKEPLSLFEIHIAALLGLKYSAQTPHIQNGSQIVKRVTAKTYSSDEVRMNSRPITLISYSNTEHNKELLRIQLTTGIMKDHAVLNEEGSFIASCIQ